MPVESRPIPNGGTRYTRWSLLELSFVSVPANANALVIARSQLSPQQQARIRFAALKAEMDAADRELVKARARRLLRELQESGAW